MTTLSKQFVPYELAVKLKELGFDEGCLALYNRSVKPVVAGNTPVYNSKTEDELIITTPLWQQAFQWFREKHNLCGEVYTVNMGAIDYTFQIRDLYSENIKHDNFEAYTSGYIGTYNTYEESQSACLIKLIEIVENEKQNKPT